MTNISYLFPPNQLIEGRNCRDLVEIRDWIDACIEAEGNVALHVPISLRLWQKIQPDTGQEIYDLETIRG